jgi:hypothetical protein
MTPTRTFRSDRRTSVLRALAVFAAMSSVGATVAVTAAPPIRADMMGNAFLMALTNAGVPYSEPSTTLALGESVCPMLVQPGGSFEAIVARMAASSGLSYESAGMFTIIAIATYCPAVIAPLFPHRLQS